MSPNARLYFCASCHKQCVICSDCDHGNIYCFDGCAEIARRKSCQAANARYQSTIKGKTHHAARQKRFRERLKQKVTDHGSNDHPKNALLSLVENETEDAIACHYLTELHCCRCQKIVPNELRRNFIQQNRRKSTPANTS